MTLRAYNDWKSSEARKLRNKITHSYDPDELEVIFTSLVVHARHIVEALRQAQAHLKLG